MNIKREQYLNELIVRKHNTLIKIITGIRRCGKSYLLNTIFYDYLIKSGIKQDHIIKFAFDSANDLSLINEDLIELSLNNRKVDPKKFINYINRQIKDNQMYYLLLDEIQNLGAFESVLNGYLRQNNIDIYVTGSNAKFLSKDIITEFAGRGDEINMLPLSFSEFMSTYEGNKEQAFQEYITYGGLPFVCLLKTNERKINYLKRLFEETYLTDIKKRYNIKNNSEELDELLNILSSSIGSLTNPTKLSNTFKSVKNKSISKTTIAKYIEYIKDSFLIDEVRQYDIKGKKYINSPKKYYFSDLGLRNARINFRQLEQTHSMENIIFNELKLRGFNVDIGIINQRAKDKNDQNIRQILEVNFVANKGSNKIYIQSAFSIPNLEKEQQEQRPLIKINDSFKKVIITSGFVSKHYNEQGILIMNIYDFLLDPNSLN
ncbi:MAG: ATP-binding protein [Malacoplasma sp.]|nr:ATP-binding protein [Malacoplasma sp.]